MAGCQWKDSIDAALVGAGAKIEPRLRFRRDPFGMLEDEAIHVRDVERAVRPRLDHRRAEPRIGAREKLAILFIGGALAREGRAVGFEHFAMHDVVDWLADENARREIRAEEFVAIRRRAVRTGDVTERLRLIEANRRAVLIIGSEDARRIRRSSRACCFADFTASRGLRRR